MLPQRTQGFSLIELVLVIVVLSILAVGTTRYIVQSTESYTAAAARSQLTASARVAVEKISRRLRNALPNSIRTSASGQCIEYVPILTAASTIGTVPLTAPGTTSLSTSPYSLNVVTPNYAVIAPFMPSEIYGQTAVIKQTNITTNQSGATSITYATPHAYLRNSPTGRVFLVAAPERICISGNNVVRYIGYGILAPTPGDGQPTGATEIILAGNIDAGAIGTPFSYNPGILNRNTIVDVALDFVRNGDPIKLTHQVHIRNVP